MDDVELNAQQGGRSGSVAIAHEAAPHAEGLAVRFFVLTMIGIVVYISAILWLMQSVD